MEAFRQAVRAQRAPLPCTDNTARMADLLRQVDAAIASAPPDECARLVTIASGGSLFRVLGTKDRLLKFRRQLAGCLTKSDPLRDYRRAGLRGTRIERHEPDSAPQSRARSASAHEARP